MLDDFIFLEYWSQVYYHIVLHLWLILFLLWSSLCVKLIQSCLISFLKFYLYEYFANMYDVYLICTQCSWGPEEDVVGSSEPEVLDSVNCQLDAGNLTPDLWKSSPSVLSTAEPSLQSQGNTIFIILILCSSSLTCPNFHMSNFHYSKLTGEGRRDGRVARTTCCSKRTGFNYHHPHGDS